MALVEAALVRNDSSEAERALRNAQNETINRFNSLESQVNALGYRFLGAGDIAKAVLTLRLNTVVYPNSANTFDSLAEALLAAGRRDEAIAAYRHAVEVEPGFPPSVQALERLGVR